jgi:hypothetical protein
LNTKSVEMWTKRAPAALLASAMKPGAAPFSEAAASGSLSARSTAV